MKHLSLEDRILEEFKAVFLPHQNKEAWVTWMHDTLTTYKSALIGEIEGKVEQCAKDLENAMVDNKSDSSWAWNNALKQSAAKLRHILSDLRT